LDPSGRTERMATSAAGQRDERGEQKDAALGGKIATDPDSTHAPVNSS